MAGGQLSPRQKMINMMYLVLLALLAMNVSAEILDAFENIHKRLEKSSSAALDGSSKFMESMIAEINEEIENEGKRDNEGLLDTLALIKSNTAKAVALLDAHIEHVRDSIIKVDEETGKLENKGETEKNLQYWMGRGQAQEADNGRGSGEARLVKDELNAYYKSIYDLLDFNTKVDSLKPDLFQLPDNIEGQDGNKKTWERFNFEGPAIANITTLESMKLDLYEKEKELLALLNQRLGVATFKADEVIALDAPLSSVVPAGLQYETKLFAVMTSSQLKPTFSSGSGSIEKDESGNFATLKIPANGARIPKGKNEAIQEYTASVRVPKATGGFQEIPVSGKFTVRRPEIVVTSAAVQILYADCGNDVNIDVPALGNNYNPRISISSGEVKPSQSNPKKFRIVPRGRKAVVSVKSLTNGSLMTIGNIEYVVIQPPKPTIEMAVNNKTYNGSAMVPKTSRIAVRLVPDGDFKSALPQDARYGIKSIDVLAQLSLGPPTKVNSVRGSTDAVNKPISVALGTKVRQSARPGTKVYVRLNEIFRKNFAGKTVPDRRFKEIERTLSLVVK